MKRTTLNLLLVLGILTVLAVGVFANPEPVAREIVTDFIIEPVDVPSEFSFWSMFEGADWYQKLLLYLPIFTSIIFVLDKIVKWTPNKYDDVIVAFIKGILTAISGNNSRKKKSRG